MNGRRSQDDPPESEDNSGQATGNARRILIVNDRLNSQDLFVATREVTIVHGNETYHLRLTAQNKLILTK